MEKRGISAIVATVLIILITVAAVAIIWVGIVPMISDNVGFDELSGRVSIVSSGGYTVYDAGEEIAIVQVKRDFDDGVMDRIKIIFSIEGNSVSFGVVAPGSGGTKTYGFDLSRWGEPDSVSVAPIFVSSSGKEKEGSVMSDIEIPKSDIDDEVISDPEFRAKLRSEEGDYFYEMPVTGLVSWWKFNGDFNDSVGGNHGVGNGDANVDDGVLNLDGNNDWVNMSPDLDYASTDMTISFWMNVRDYSSPNRQNPINKAYGGDGTFTLEPSGGITFYFGSYGGNAQNYTSNSVSGVIEGVWQHWVIVRNRGDRTTQWYKNGMTSGALYNYAEKYDPVHSTNPLTIGDGYTNSLNGSMDNVMIYNRALGDEDVMALYENQKKN